MKKIFKLLGFIFLLSTAQAAFSHGSVIYPASRIYNCYTNGSPVCGSCGSSIYDWMSVLQPNTNNGNHQAYVPNGQIASGGNAKFSCLDALTTAWPATTVNYGYIDVKWKNTAPHLSEYYKVYITQLNWDPTKPLRWNELIEIGSVGKRPAESYTIIRSFIPDSYAGKRAAIVSIWQRDFTQSQEAFYSVSDILVAGGGGCTTGSPVSVTFTNNSNCTLQYYQNNSLKGSANAGGSYAANTTVGSQWEARKTSGEQVSSFTIACGQSSYNSTGQCAVSGNTPPAINITSPANSASYKAPATIAIAANANDADGSITKVEFYNGGTKLGEDASSPYSYNWTGVAVGAYTITATATDNRGATASQSVAVKVTNDSGGGICTDSEWSASKIYVANDKASYQQNVYKAKWWTQNENPAANSGASGVWSKEGSCGGGGGTGCGTTPAYDAAKVYAAAGNRVSYQGKIYENKWWTQGDIPGSEAGPWKFVSNCPAAAAKAIAGVQTEDIRVLNPITGLVADIIIQSKVAELLVVNIYNQQGIFTASQKVVVRAGTNTVKINVPQHMNGNLITLEFLKKDKKSVIKKGFRL